MALPQSICSPGGRGMLLPLLESEQSWPSELRGALYAVAMLYCFLGVSLIADTFMAAIEAITSRRKQVRLANGRTSAVKAWNETVATLTLMALGSSAPEICLSVIELFKNEFHVGELGPSTIVGSAAFNLLVIVAVCIMAIPANEVRKISELPAFCVTVVFSLGAYMWLVFILTMNTVDVVDIWEAALTLLMGPLFVYVAFRTDRRDLCKLWPGNLLCRASSGEALESPEGSLSDEATFSFAAERLMVCRQPEETQTMEVVVLRSGDCDAPASSTYHTECLSAVPGFDYEETFGTLCFAPGQREAVISLDILPSRKRRWQRRAAGSHVGQL